MTGDFDDLDLEIITSRRALIDVITGLADQREALTVLGGHAVIGITQAIPTFLPDDTTRDGDLGVIPQRLSDDPNLSAHGGAWLRIRASGAPRRMVTNLAA